MSEEIEQQQERFGSKFAQMFGYITPEDRGKWEQQRSQSKPSVSAVKQGAKMSSGSMLDFGERNVNARLSAAHRVMEQTHVTATSKFDPRSQSIVESYSYDATGDENKPDDLEPDLEM